MAAHGGRAGEKGGSAGGDGGLSHARRPPWLRWGPVAALGVLLAWVVQRVWGQRPPPAQQASQVRCPGGRTHPFGGWPANLLPEHGGGGAAEGASCNRAAEHLAAAGAGRRGEQARRMRVVREHAEPAAGAHSASSGLAFASSGGGSSNIYHMRQRQRQSQQRQAAAAAAAALAAATAVWQRQRRWRRQWHRCIIRRGMSLVCIIDCPVAHAHAHVDGDGGLMC